MLAIISAATFLLLTRAFRGTRGGPAARPQPWTAQRGYPDPVDGLQRAQEFALSMPGVTEEPHFDMSSFRVRGKIFATVPADGRHLHVFVDDAEVEAAVAEDPAAFEPLRWGQRIRGLRIRLAVAPAPRVAELIEESWRRKAPARLVADFERRNSR